MQQIITIDVPQIGTAKTPENATYLGLFFVGNQMRVAYQLTGTLENVTYRVTPFYTINLQDENTVPDGYHLLGVAYDANNHRTLHVFTR